MSDTDEPTKHLWRVTSSPGEDGASVELEIGPALSKMPISDTAKVRLVGRALLNLGTQLVSSRASDDDDWGEDED